MEKTHGSPSSSLFAISHPARASLPNMIRGPYEGALQAATTRADPSLVRVYRVVFKEVLRACVRSLKHWSTYLRIYSYPSQAYIHRKRYLEASPPPAHFFQAMPMPHRQQTGRQTSSLSPSLQAKGRGMRYILTPWGKIPAAASPTRPGKLLPARMPLTSRHASAESPPRSARC